MPSESHRGAWRHDIYWRWAILVCWCGCLFFYGLSGPLYRTESLRAIIGQSALDGHWLTPTLYGEPFLTKPPGAYAAIGLVSLPIGRVTEETARLPSALAATLTVFFIFATLRRSLGESRAFIAALVLPISLLWLDKVPSAEIDMLQLAWVAAANLSLLRAVAAGEAGRLNRRSQLWWLAALACVAGGFLTKWTAPAFFYLTAVPFLWARGRLGWLFGRQHILAFLVGAGICSGWAILVAHEVGWSRLADTVGREAAQRFAPKTVGKPYPWLESLSFPIIVLIANLPWSIPAVVACRRRFRTGLDPDEFRLVQLLHCWAWPNLIFWSLPAQHNVRYVLPICPALTVLGVLVAIRWFESGTWLRSPRVALASFFLAWLVVKVVFVEAVVAERTAHRNARETGMRLATLVPDGQILYLCRLKDEGILFYYERPARRFEFAMRPVGYALLLDDEWQRIRGGGCRYICQLRDQQQAPIHLVCFGVAEKDDSAWQAQQPQNPTKSSASPP